MKSGGVGMKWQQKPRHKRMAGLSLVELMVAIGLGVIISTGVLNVFIASKRGYYEDEQMANLQENARFALRTLRRELMMAGYMGGSISVKNQLDPVPCKVLPSEVTVLPPDVDNDCAADWAATASVPVEVEGDVAAGYGDKCAADVVPGTDVFALRRTADEFTIEDGELNPDAAIDNKRLYFVRDPSQPDMDAYVTNGVGVNGIPGKATPSSQVYASEYFAKTFFIRDYSVDPGDGIPCLAMASLTGAPAMQTDCLVEGVEDMQIVFGIDTTGMDPPETDPVSTVTADRIPDKYVDVPTPDACADGKYVADEDEYRRITSATIYLLVRSVGEVQGHFDTKSYTLGNKVVPAKVNDRHLRRVFSTTVRMPNITNLE